RRPRRCRTAGRQRNADDRGVAVEQRHLAKSGCGCAFAQRGGRELRQQLRLCRRETPRWPPRRLEAGLAQEFTEREQRGEKISVRRFVKRSEFLHRRIALSWLVHARGADDVPCYCGLLAFAVASRR